MIRYLFSIVDLFFAEMHRQKCRYHKSRKHLDKIIDRNVDGFEFLVAYDAQVMVGEDRLPEARSRFEESLSLHSENQDADSKYIS